MSPIFKKLSNPISKIVLQYRLKARKTNYIFLFSHMRGYTSLLSHILGSNPEIKGYSEMHQSYRSTFGLLRLRYFSKLTTNSLEVPRFLYDKLLHNKYQVSKKILNQRNVYPIIMIREPESTIKSIINMGEKMTKVVGWYRKPNEVVKYYEKRLLRLQTIAKRANGEALFIEGHQLIDFPKETLTTVSNYLQLNEPLSESYDTFSLTGSIGAGDPSDNIKTGKIVKNRDQYESIKIDDELLQRATSIYLETKDILQQECKLVHMN